MMVKEPVNRERWNWLLKTYHTLDDKQREYIIGRFSRYRDPISMESDDTQLLNIMMEMGVTIIGQDPHPPAVMYATDAGAEEYQEIMDMQCTSILIGRR